MTPATNGHQKPPTPNDSALGLLALGRIHEALTILQDLAWKDPSYKSFYNYAVALRHAGQFGAAEDYLTRAIKLDFKSPNAWLTLANVHTDTGQWDKALQYYEGAYSRLKPSQDLAAAQQVSLGFAQALLRAHRFKEAWKYWELGRYGRSWAPLPGTKPWGGEKSECVLILCEGGFGDAMLFARWIPYVAAVAKKVKLLIWKPMIKFRDWSALGVDEVLSKDEPIHVARVEHCISWLSLPAIAGMESVSDIPRDHGLLDLSASPQNRVGFCWRAEENGQLRRTRSLSKPDADQIASELGVVYSLAPHGKSLNQDFNASRTPEPWPENVIQDDSLLAGWAATANLIRSCKLVVSVDTAVAHLAGLCGVPTLLLLPCSSDWKWGTPENTLTDPWYGPHVRYFRNKDPLQWDVDAILEAASCITQTS